MVKGKGTNIKQCHFEILRKMTPMNCYHSFEWCTGLTNVVWADRNLPGIWLTGMTQCNCNLCSPRLHMMSNTVQCSVHLSRFVPYPCYPYPEPVVRRHLEYQSMPIKTNSCKSATKNSKQLMCSGNIDFFFLPYTMSMAFAFVRTMILASIQRNLRLLRSSDSSVHL